MTEKSQHVTHCCIVHGCKYGDEDCPIVTGEAVQMHPCITCEDREQTITNTNDVILLMMIDRLDQIVKSLSKVVDLIQESENYLQLIETSCEKMEENINKVLGKDREGGFW